MRSVSVRLDDLRTMILNLGFVGENEHTRVLIDAKKMYDQYPTASASLTVSPPHGAAYPAVIERDGDLISWDVTDSDLIHEGAGEFQLAFTVDEVVAKSYIGRFRVSRSIIPTGEIPEPLDDFLTRAGAALTAIPETIDEALGEVTAEAETLAAGSEATALYNNALKQFTFGIPRGADGQAGAPGRDGTDGKDGQDGAPGADGFSPSASVTKSGSTATITITDKTGTTTAQISDGESGASVIDDNAGVGDTDKVWSADKTATENGNLLSHISVLQPSATSGDVGKFLKAKTVTDGKVSEYEFGSASGGGVSDVQVNGTSVVSSGVANVPVASSSDYGVVKVDSNYGVSQTDGKLTLGYADDAKIKAGATYRAALTPYYQNKVVFYGLSKAAGEDLKNDTVTVGTYPEKSLSAISQMLNAPVSVSGTTPSITAKAGVRYICGEVSTLTITVPTSGCIDVVFESGSTATVLTVTPTKTGVTAIKWAGSFDPTSLDANTVYEVNIMDGEYGVVGSWT